MPLWFGRSVRQHEIAEFAACPVARRSGIRCRAVGNAFGVGHEVRHQDVIELLRRRRQVTFGGLTRSQSVIPPLCCPGRPMQSITCYIGTRRK